MRFEKEKIRKFCTVQNVFEALYVTAVFTLLLIPSLGVRTKKDLYVDHRPAAPFPECSCKNLKAFAPQFEKWLSDRFQMRKGYIRVWNFFLLHLFHEPPHEQIVLGSDGFVFLAGHNADKAHKNSLFKDLLAPDPETVRMTAEGLLALQPTFRKARPQLLFVTIPTKHSLNYDKLPEKLRREFRDNPAGIPVGTKITQILKEKDPAFAEKYFLDLYPDALTANRQMQLIPPGNFHWVPGPYTHLAAHRIARKFNVTQEPFVLRRENYRLTELSSDVKHFFGFDLKSPGWIHSEKCAPVPTHPFTQRFSLKNSSEVFSNMSLYAENPAAKGGRILAIGDSFTPALCQDLARYFSKVTVMDFAAMRRYSPQQADAFLKEAVSVFQPEYFIVISHVSYIFTDAVTALINDPACRFQK